MTSNTRLGVILMTVVSFIFAVQDGISQHLAREYNTLMIVMIRYWAFAGFVLVLASSRPGGIRAAAHTNAPKLQVFRAVLLALEICVAVTAFALLGLVESHAIFACYPLIIAMMSGPILGETIGWKRRLAIFAGFIGVLVILRPGLGAFSPYAIIPVISATMFALYGVLTRFVARYDRTSTSFFYTGIVGAIVMTAVGIWFWEPMSTRDWGWMLTLCCTAMVGHWLLIKTYEVAEASAVQPFAYFQLVFASMIGVSVFHERMSLNIVIGAAIVVAAGLFTLTRSRKAKAE